MSVNIPILEMPDDPAELPTWLEDQLIGPDLRLLVAELSAVHGTQEELSFEDVLHEKRALIHRQGLAVLDAVQIRVLLTHPQLLLELQEDVLIHGGGYWRERIVRVPFDKEAIVNGWQRLHQEVISPPPKVPWYKQPWFVSLLTAAVVLLAVVFGKPSPTEEWGWNRPGVLATNLPADAYLNGLADAAEEWFDQRPETPQALAHRILQFRQGCSTLILDDHKPLATKDRIWLIEKCQAWAAKLDAHLAALEAGEDVQTVRQAADETVKNLVSALQGRAKIVV